MKTQTCCVAFAIAFVIAAALPGAAMAVASFQGLGDLAGGIFSSFPRGVSADGSVAVGASSSALGNEAFRWTSGGGMVGLGDLAGGSFGFVANAASSDGSVVVGNGGSASGGEAFRWVDTNGNGVVDASEKLDVNPGFALGDLAGGGFFSVGLGVSADGLVVVGRSSSALGTEAFRWTSGGGMVGLGDLPGGSFQSIANGVSADGSVAVGRGRSDAAGLGTDVFEAFRWTQAGGMVGLGDLAGGKFESIALGVSADGSVVVGSSISALGIEAFRWTAGFGMVGLGDLAGGSFGSTANAASSDGSVVVGFGRSASGQEASIWDQTNGMRSIRDLLVNDFGLDLTGWTLADATGISADGLTIVGVGSSNPSGQNEAWIATIPEPATLTLLALGSLTLLRRRGGGWRV